MTRDRQAGRERERDATATVEVPFDRELVSRIVARCGFDIRRASIREMNQLVAGIEAELGTRFIRMEFGVPGVPLHPIAIEAEAAALREAGVGPMYAPFEGIPELKQEAARFAKLFLGIDLPPACCIPTVGAMEGCFASLALAGRLDRSRRTVLCLQPGFPVNRIQLRMLGIESASIDFYDHRGDSLLRAVEARARRGDLCAILWSSPNNPSWIVLKDSELRGLGRICDEHGLLAIEDLAYFAMDTRQDYTVAGRPPYQPTVLRHTRRGICIVSSSKMFSYAGQRIALALLSPELMDAEAPDLERWCGTSRIGRAFVPGLHYPLVACVPQTPQHGLLALLRAANDGERSLFAPGREYARRARIMKPLFLENGFRLVYDNDMGEPLADGFYFTVAYPGFDHGAELLRELLHYGVSAITLESAGSRRVEGLRACVSMTSDEQFPILERRLARFHRDHPHPGP